MVECSQIVPAAVKITVGVIWVAASSSGEIGGGVAFIHSPDCSFQEHAFLA